MALHRASLPPGAALLLLLLAASAPGVLAPNPCAAGTYWDAASSSCQPCGFGRWCAGGAAAPVACPWSTGTTTPTAASASNCNPVACDPCGAPAPFFQPRDIVFSTGGGIAVSPPNSLFIQFGDEGGLSAPAHFICSFGALSAPLGDVAVLHNGDILVLQTSGAFKLLPAVSLATLRAANSLDVTTQTCSNAGAIELPAAASLPWPGTETWGGLTTGLVSNVLYASRNQGRVCSYEFSGSGASLRRNTTAFVCRTCATAPAPYCSSNSGTDLTAGADGNLYLWAGQDSSDPFSGFRLPVTAATGHLHPTDAIVLTNRGLTNGANTDRTFTNAAAMCVNGSVLGLAVRSSTTVGAVWRFGDQFSGSVTPAVATSFALRTVAAKVAQSSFRFNGAAARPLCVDCGACNTTNTASCSDRGCACKAGFAGADCSEPADCSGPPTALANATWTCAGSTPHGANCSATCDAGFSGSATAACSFGAYAAPVGSCVKACARWFDVPSGDTVARTRHGAALLSTGDVLVVGGSDSSGTSSVASLYSPSQFELTATASMSTARDFVSVTAFNGGQLVLVAGGQDSASSPLKSAEVYNATSGTWTSVADMAVERTAHAAVLITGGSSSGSVLLVGGSSSIGSSIAAAELWDGATFTSAGSLVAGSRVYPTATSLPGGKVLVVGGTDDTALPIAPAELWESGSFTATADLAVSRFLHTATAVAGGGAVLVVGGDDGAGPLSSAELYNVSAGTWSSAGALAEARSSPTATLLHDGTVVVCGGLGNFGSYLSSCEAWRADNPTTWQAYAPLGTARGWHAAAVLLDGRALILDGETDLGFTNSTEIYGCTSAD